MTKQTPENAPPPEPVSRREFLKFGSAGFLGMSAAEQAALRAKAQPNDNAMIDSCLLLLLTGGPSQLETFDPKPQASAGIRGPFSAIQTAIPGVQFSETLPSLAARADRFSVIRSLHHTAAPIHETGLQLIQTGRTVQNGNLPPAIGSVVAAALGARGDAPPYFVLPNLLGDTGVHAFRGQTAGTLGSAYDPFFTESYDESVLDVAATGYGTSPFARNCLLARQLIEHGVRFVTVNMYDGLQQSPTWDCHANRGHSGTTLDDYRNLVCPDFDNTLAALLDDLQESGLLKRTLVVAVGEMGRSPIINPNGGRDHWPSVWSALVAGGPTPGGQIIGASDARGSLPLERPLTPASLASTILTAFGIESQTKLKTAQGDEYATLQDQPIPELLTNRT